MKRFLREEDDDSDGYVKVLVIDHNKHAIYLQMNGWSINLYDDGTWFWEDTTGG